MSVGAPSSSGGTETLDVAIRRRFVLGPGEIGDSGRGGWLGTEKILEQRCIQFSLNYECSVAKTFLCMQADMDTLILSTCRAYIYHIMF